jgi:lipopolysaccharide export system protein LptC
MRPTSWLPLAVLALLVGLTLWLNTLVQPAVARADGSLRHDPDAIVEHFDARKLGVDGRVLYTLAAKKMVHYPDDDSALLETLTLEAFEPGQPKMTITADHGRLEQAGDRVWIEGNVVLVREGDAKIEPVRITTDKMLVLPDAGIARTDTEVRLASPSSHAVAQGAEIDNKARTITAEHVVAHLEPAKKP